MKQLPGGRRKDDVEKHHPFYVRDSYPPYKIEGLTLYRDRRQDVALEMERN